MQIYDSPAHLFAAYAAELETPCHKASGRLVHTLSPSGLTLDEETYNCCYLFHIARESDRGRWHS